MSDLVEFYRDDSKMWRWRYVSSNGHILADSGQGYRRRIDCAHGARRVLHAPLVFDDGPLFAVTETHPQLRAVILP